MPRPDLSIIIVSFNTRELLRGCLAALPAALGPGLTGETIVVDNASADGSAAMVAAAFPEAELLANTTNAGFAAASNRGLSRSTGRHLVLLNPDTAPRPGSLAALVDFLDA